MRMLFRDHYLSDLIGFQYSHMSAADAAGAFPVRGFGENAGGTECAGADHSRRRKRLGMV